MSAIECSGYKIPASQYALFRYILSDCNGSIQYVYSIEGDSVVRVGFTFPRDCDYVKFNREWDLVTLPVNEIRRDSGWRCLLRRLHLGFIEKRIMVKGN